MRDVQILVQMLVLIELLYHHRLSSPSLLAGGMRLSRIVQEFGWRLTGSE